MAMKSPKNVFRRFFIMQRNACKLTEQIVSSDLINLCICELFTCVIVCTF